MRGRIQFEKQYEWVRKGKKYRETYLKAYGLLMGDTNGKEASECDTDRRPGTDQTSDLVNETRDKIFRNT